MGFLSFHIDQQLDRRGVLLKIYFDIQPFLGGDGYMPLEPVA